MPRNSPLQYTTIGNLDNPLWDTKVVASFRGNGPNRVHALNHFSEYRMLAIEPRRLGGANEKLGTVGIRASWSSIERVGVCS